MVELEKTMRPLPYTRNGVRRLIAPCSMGLLVQAMVVRVSELAGNHGDTIAELEFNPLICAGDCITAVDAIIVKANR